MDKNSIKLIQELYPHVNDPLKLPTAWSTKDKAHLLTVSHNKVFLSSLTKNHQKEAAAVRSNYPIPSDCAMYYFEVYIKSKGRDGYIGIGLSVRKFSTNKLPGWEKQSYGYHGDDGLKFTGTSFGDPYGPTFTTGDTIGCGVNLLDHSCFFTKNGIYLGVACKNLPKGLYPTVGLQTSGETVVGNFGSEEFIFDFKGELETLHSETIHSILKRNFPTSYMENMPTATQQLILSYLVFHGYSESAKSFSFATKLPIQESDESISNRQNLRNLIQQGKISQVVNLCNELYPGLLQNNSLIHFKLRCRQFLEALDNNDTISDSDNSLMNGNTTYELIGPVQSHNSLDEYQKLILFGREQVQMLAAKVEDEGHMTNELRTLLKDTFSLLAYSNHRECPVSYLFQPSERYSLSAALNSAVLEKQGLPVYSPLEVLVQHANNGLNHFLKCLGVNFISFLKLNLVL